VLRLICWCPVLSCSYSYPYTYLLSRLSPHISTSYYRVTDPIVTPETVCDNKEIIETNIHNIKISSPDVWPLPPFPPPTQNNLSSLPALPSPPTPLLPPRPHLQTKTVEPRLHRQRLLQLDSRPREALATTQKTAKPIAHRAFLQSQLRSVPRKLGIRRALNVETSSSSILICIFRASETTSNQMIDREET
jgi:hypothetical protein